MDLMNAPRVKPAAQTKFVIVQRDAAIQVHIRALIDSFLLIQESRAMLPILKEEFTVCTYTYYLLCADLQRSDHGSCPRQSFYRCLR